MVFVESKKAAEEFSRHWENRWDEKQETQKFWNSLLQEIFWVKANDIKKVIDYEKKVKSWTTKFIDWYINNTKVLIEQKSFDIDLYKAEKQSDWEELTPYQQAKRYADNLWFSEKPRWIITCNFQEFHIHDMEKPNDDPWILYLKDLSKEYHRLKFIVDSSDTNTKKEMELSMKAWEIVWKLYDCLAPLYENIKKTESQKSLNVLCVRLVFCLYAEDAWVFWIKNLFHDYLYSYKTDDLRDALIKLFAILDQKVEERSPYLTGLIAKFPYVNWWLFAEKNIEIPNFTEEAKDLLLKQASEDFDWSEISPTIFWAVFESTLNPETRRSWWMHYTSIENIHKIIDPLFLNELNEELERILKLEQQETIRKRARALQEKMANLKFLDPACWSGNFLTETYLSLRKIENKLIAKEGKWIARLINPIEVNINQFYWIEINDFAVSVAKTALWIAESQMMNETENILETNLDFLPLKTNANIIEWNALRIDWNDVIQNKECNYIIWNPPFIGMKEMTDENKEDMKLTVPVKKFKQMDYVACRYFKAEKYIDNTDIEVAFVSSNSITQWEQALTIRPYLFENNIVINFAYRTFKWESEASLKAAVHCVIIGFSKIDKKNKIIFEDWRKKIVKHINHYLTEWDSIFIDKTGLPICKWIKEMTKWAQLIDWWNFILTKEEFQEALNNEPFIKDYIKRYYNAHDLINWWEEVYALYLENCPPDIIRKSKLLKDRVEKVYNYRANNDSPSTNILKNTPSKYFQPQVPNWESIVVPVVSSINRKYIPICFMSKWMVYTNALFFIDNADIYTFWIITSNVHMARTRTIAGRLKSDYRYSNTMVYNTFPRPNPTDEQKKEIEQTGKAILDVRKQYPNSSLADLYYEHGMPKELQKAHEENDKAVMKAYWFNPKMSESEIVSKLMEIYQELTKK